MDTLEQIQRYQEEEIDKHSERLTEIISLKKVAEEEGGPEDVKVQNVADGYYELRIVAAEITAELVELLDLNIVKDTEVQPHRAGIKIIGRLDYDPMTVATANYVEDPHNEETVASNE